MIPENLIYLDHQASTPMCDDSIQAVTEAMRSNYANPHSADHAAGWLAAATVDEARERILTALEATDHDVIFTSGATEANNLAILGCAEQIKRSNSAPPHIAVCAADHKSTIEAAIIAAERTNGALDLIPIQRDGQIDISALSHSLNRGARLVSISASNGEIGTVHPPLEIGRLCEKFGAHLHIDASQVVALGELGDVFDYADFISFSGHKTFGPKGIGALLARHTATSAISPQILGGAQQNNLRSGTLPTPLIVGLAAAVSYSRLHRETLSERTRDARDSLWKSLIKRLKNIQLVGPPLENRHPANLNVRFCGAPAKSLLAMLQPHVAAASGSACSSGVEHASHVLRALGLREEEANECVRFSVGPSTSKKEVTAAADLIASAVMQLRRL